MFVKGRVTHPKGTPLAKALLDVWQANEKRQYDVQDTSGPDFNFRGRFYRADA